ncbi:MAG TPA: hypothetical protein VEJ40_05435 [Pseudolabrys sp.]|nr:hypothetical protein [Pseudolabrys sp.]
MRIGEIRSAALGNLPAHNGDRPAAEGRALVAVAPPPRQASTVPGNHRQAPFLAHLLAVRDQHAQTRERRRAEPHEAIAAYRAAAGLLEY